MAIVSGSRVDRETLLREQRTDDHDSRLEVPLQSRQLLKSAQVSDRCLWPVAQRRVPAVGGVDGPFHEVHELPTTDRDLWPSKRCSYHTLVRTILGSQREALVGGRKLAPLSRDVTTEISCLSPCNSPPARVHIARGRDSTDALGQYAEPLPATQRRHRVPAQFPYLLIAERLLRTAGEDAHARPVVMVVLCMPHSVSAGATGVYRTLCEL